MEGLRAKVCDALSYLSLSVDNSVGSVVDIVRHAVIGGQQSLGITKCPNPVDDSWNRGSTSGIRRTPRPILQIGTAGQTWLQMAARSI